MDNFFINSRGVKVECLPVSQDYINDIRENVKKKFEVAKEPLEVPYRETEVMGGGKTKQPLTDWFDKEGKLTEGLTDEEKEKLTNHLDALKRLEAEQNEIIGRVFILKGIKLENIPKEWIEEQEFFGNPLPDNFMERKYQYSKAELTPTERDATELGLTCTMLAFTGLTEEARTKFRNSFWNHVARQRQQREDAFTRITDNGRSENGGGMDLQSDISEYKGSTQGIENIAQ